MILGIEKVGMAMSRLKLGTPTFSKQAQTTAIERENMVDMLLNDNGSKRLCVKPQVISFSDLEKRLMTDVFGEILSSGAVSDGKYCKQFGEQNAEMVGSGHGVACSNGTAAIEIALRALEPERRTVLVPTNTATPTALGVMHANYLVRWIDTGGDGPNVTLKTIKASYSLDSERVGAVIVVHVAGHPVAEMEEIANWCSVNGLVLIEDCAHGHGVHIGDRHVGSFGDAATFSYYATKVLSIGEGGAIVFKDKDAASLAIALVNQGKNSWGNHFSFGNNWRLPELLAGPGTIVMSLRDYVFRKRKEIGIYYDTHIPDNALVAKIPLPSGSRSTYYKYLLSINPNLKGKFLAGLDVNGVKCPQGTYSVLAHEQELFKGDQIGHYLDRSQPDLGNARYFAESHIALPIYRGMTEQDVEYVASAVNQVSKDLVDAI